MVIPESPMIKYEDWDTLKSLFPKDWIGLGKKCGAIQRLREFHSPEVLMRVLLIHLARGLSLRETAVRAREAGLVSVSDVAILKRLKKCEPWFRRLAIELFEENDSHNHELFTGYNLRVVDATKIHEPGKTGSNWVIHYCLCLPALECDYFELCPAKGKGHGETLKRFPVASGDLFLADRGYCTGNGIEHVCSQGGEVVVRLIPNNLKLYNKMGESFDLLDALSKTETGVPDSWNVHLSDRFDSRLVRVCSVKKTAESIQIAQRKLRRAAAKCQTEIKPETLEFAKYVLVLTSLPEKEWPAERVLELYRVRWQIELVFKRFKSIAHLGHLPKHDEDSIRAWLSGKIFVALLSEKLVRLASSFSPWGLTGFLKKPERLARI